MTCSVVLTQYQCMMHKQRGRWTDRIAV